MYYFNETERIWESEKELHVQKNYKDTVFRMLFRDKPALLSLYNAVNGTDYEDPEDLEIVTLENAIYMNMKNDISFLFDFQIHLYEHQSTYNPNIPIRNLFYLARQYEKLLEGEWLYGSRRRTLPTPRFMVFYNGTDDQPERQVLKLSDCFEIPRENPELELKATMINVNLGKNRELMEHCQKLHEYAVFVDKTRKYQKFLPIGEAVEQSVQECITEGILKEFLLKNRREVVQMSIFEYDQEAHMKLLREEGREDGWQDGWEAGRENGREAGIQEGTQKSMVLTARLLKENRLEDLKRATEDESFREQLCQELQI